MLIINYQGRPVAVVMRGRPYLLPSLALLEVDHPRRRWATCMAFFGRDVATGRLLGPYSTGRAEHFARCALVPDEEFLALEQYPESVLAEYFNVPIEQVAEKRADLEVARQLDALEASAGVR